jgi:hypothetical protein
LRFGAFALVKVTLILTGFTGLTVHPVIPSNSFLLAEAGFEPAMCQLLYYACSEGTSAPAELTTKHNVRLPMSSYPRDGYASFRDSVIFTFQGGPGEDGWPLARQNYESFQAGVFPHTGSWGL